MWVKKIYSVIGILFILAVCPLGHAQTVLKGTIMDKDKQPVFAANIFSQTDHSVGTVTDLDGNFVLSIKDEGDSLIISSIGYHTEKINIADLKVKDAILISLNENMHLLPEVFIGAEDPISQRFAVTKLTRFDVYMNPVSQGDPLKAISILPNSTTTDESANPALRGSSGNSSIVTLNGVPIYNPVRSGDLNSQFFFSLFNPEIIDKQYVYTSNPPLTYGNTIAGLVEIQTNKLSSKNQLQISTSLGSLGGLLTTNLKEDKSSMQLYYNHQFSDLFIGIQDKYYPNIKNFSTDDAGLNFYQKMSKNLEWKSYHYLIHEKFSGFNEDYTYRGEVNTKNDRYFTVNSFRYFKDWYSLVLNNGYNYSDSDYKFGNTFSNNINNQSYTSINFKTYPLYNLEVQTGISFDYNRNKYNDTIPHYYYAQFPDAPKCFSKTKITNKILETYLYANWDINNKLSLSSGIRKNIPIEGQNSYLSYQLGLNYIPNKNHSFIVGGGKYNNYLLPSFYTKKYANLSNSQFSLDYRFDYKNTSMKSAVYYKMQKGDQMSNTIYNLSYSRVETFGIEFSYEQEFLTYFKFTFNNAFINQKLRIGDKKYHGSSDLNYYIKSVIEYNNTDLFSASLSYTGRPGTYYHTVTSTQYNNELDVYKPLFQDDLYSSQYGNYNRVDLTINKYIPLKKTALAVFLSVNNLFDIKNQKKVLYNKNYTERSYDYYQRRSLYFGGVWYFSL